MLPTPSSLLVIFLLLARHGLLARADLGVDLDVTKESSNNVHINGSLTELADAANHALGLLDGGSGSTPPSSPTSTAVAQGLAASGSGSANFTGSPEDAEFQAALSFSTGAGSGGSFGSTTNTSVFGAPETIGVGGPEDTGNPAATSFEGLEYDTGQGQTGGGSSGPTTVAGGSGQAVQTPFPGVHDDHANAGDGTGSGEGNSGPTTVAGGSGYAVQTPPPGGHDDYANAGDGTGSSEGNSGPTTVPGGHDDYANAGDGTGSGGGNSGPTTVPGGHDDYANAGDGTGSGEGNSGPTTVAGGSGHAVQTPIPGGHDDYANDGTGSDGGGAATSTPGAGDSGVTSSSGPGLGHSFGAPQTSGSGNGNPTSSSGGGREDYYGGGGATTGPWGFGYPSATTAGPGSGCATAPTIIAPSGFPAATYPPSVDALNYLSSSVYRQKLPASIMTNPTMMTCLASALYSVQKSWVMNPSAWSDINAIWSAASHEPAAVASMSTTWNYVAIMTEPWYSSYVPPAVQADVTSYDAAWMSLWAAITNSPSAPCPAPTATPGPCDGFGGNYYAAGNVSGVVNLGGAASNASGVVNFGGAASNVSGVVNLGFTAGCTTLTGTAFGGGMSASVSCSTGFSSAWWNSGDGAARTTCSNTTDRSGMPTQTCMLVNGTGSTRADYNGATPVPSPLPVALTAGLLTVFLAVVLIL